MERLTILAPALLGVAFMLLMLGVYSVLCALGRTPDIDGVDRRRFTELFGPYLVRYILWLIRPVERLLTVGRVSPNSLTALSLLSCVGAGWAVAAGHLASATWLYVLAGILDILDGRLARATGRQTKAGALFDSVADRWGELAVFTGCAWYLHQTLWLLTVMCALGGSVMVSYTRARGEGLGINLDGGTMQRAERIVLVALGMLIAAWLAASPSTAAYAQPALGAALLTVGIGSAVTALGRWLVGYRKLVALDAARAEREAAPVPANVRRIERPSRPSPRVEAPPPQPSSNMRITGEHTA